MHILAATNMAASDFGYILGVALVLGILLLPVVLFIVFLVMAIRKKTAGWIAASVITGVLSLAIVGLLVIGAIGAVAKRQMDKAEKQGVSREVVSSDKTCKLTIPGHWKVIEELCDAQIKVGNGRNEEYLIVTVELKSDFEKSMTLNEYAEITTDNTINALEGGSKEAAKNLTINGLNAIEHKLYGSANRVKLVYSHVTIEGKYAYYRIVGWTLPSKANVALETIKQVASTFVELDAAKDISNK